MIAFKPSFASGSIPLELLFLRSINVQRWCVTCGHNSTFRVIRHVPINSNLPSLTFAHCRKCGKFLVSDSIECEIEHMPMNLNTMGGTDLDFSFLLFGNIVSSPGNVVSKVSFYSAFFASWSDRNFISEHKKSVDLFVEESFYTKDHPDISNINLLEQVGRGFDIMPMAHDMAYALSLVYQSKGISDLVDQYKELDNCRVKAVDYLKTKKPSAICSLVSIEIESRAGTRAGLQHNMGSINIYGRKS